MQLVSIAWMAKNPIQNLIDSGLQFTEMQRKEAEKVVKKLVKSGEVRRAEAEKTVQSLIEKGKETSAAVAAIVKAEVTKQLGWLANRVDDIEDQVEGLVSRVSGGGDVEAVACTGCDEGRAGQAHAGGPHDRGEEGARQEGRGQEGTGEEGTGRSQDGRQEDRRLELRPSGRWPLAAASTPSCCVAA